MKVLITYIFIGFRDGIKNYQYRKWNRQTKFEFRLMFLIFTLITLGKG